MLRARLTLSEIYGDGYVVNCATSFTRPGLLPDSQPMLDYLTGGKLTNAGISPVICSQSVATDRSLELLRRLGFETTDALAYDSASSYRNLVADTESRGAKMVVQHAHPVDEISSETYWIDRGLLQFLNNKANLGALVPSEHVPARRVVAAEALESLADNRLTRPVIIKAATDASTGAGADVRVCRSARDVRAALAQFGSHTDRFVVEDLLDFDWLGCTQFVALPDGSLDHVGTAELVSDEEGRYRGNYVYIEQETDPVTLDLGYEIMRAASELGYRGYAGFDVGRTADGKTYVFDLNFRLTGSAETLLFRDAIAREYDVTVLRSRGWLSTLPFEDLEARIDEAFTLGLFLPFYLFDSPARLDGVQAPALKGVVMGNSVSEVNQREKGLEEVFAGGRAVADV